MAPRRYYRRSFKPKDKYSFENSLWTVNTSVIDNDPPVVDTNYSCQAVQTIVPSTSVRGMRKVKHITFTISGSADCLFAIVYVPIGTSPNYLAAIAYPDTIYEPSQFVMMCGQIESSAGPNRVRCPLARNLNEGDQIVLLLANSSAVQTYYITATYAISF